MMETDKYAAYASVILDIRLDMTLDYGIAEDQLSQIFRGSRVEVFVRGKLQKGFILEIKPHSEFPGVKPLHKILSEGPLVPDELFDLALWISRYYCSNPSDIFRLILPPGIRKGMSDKEQLFVMRGKTREEIIKFCQENRNKKPAQVAILDAVLKITKGILLTKLLEESKGTRSSVNTLAKSGWLKLETVKIDRSPLIDEDYFMTKPKILNEEQDEALKKVVKSLQAHVFETHLIHGVTSSGKTEVYLQAIEEALKLDKGIIMLVPEIALTGQTIERFRCRFKEKMAILHHRLSQGERNDEWHHIRTGKAKIVIGARSAIFSPVMNLGLIIIDEEHEQSYKQNDLAPCYQARDVAVMRGKFNRATVLLGSATPSLDSYYNAHIGKYTLSVLNNRADTASLPIVTIVDMKKEMEKNKGMTNFSDALLSGIEKRQERGEQTILFLNRRGYHTNMLCQDCHKPIKCHQCDSTMTFHLNENCLSCHLCGYQLIPPPKECPNCKGTKPLKFRGAGTEQIERALHAIFPGIRTLRMDADTTKHKGSHQKILRQFGTGKADVLIGTQMIAKGLHFSEVTLVGVLNSDSGLNIPDFRAAETTFQLITQVSGRSGRGSSKGEVIIQTFLPENSTIQFAARQNYQEFYQEEIEIRKIFAYPPFSRIAKLVFSGKQAEKVLQAGQEAREMLIRTLPSYFEFLPVVPCGHAKIKELFRFQFMLKSPSLALLNQAFYGIKKNLPLLKSIRVSIDVDPSSTFF